MQTTSKKPQATSLKLYNSLTRQLETFEPLDPDKPVGVYTCGPTVYDYVTIGNWRSYTLGDLVVRTLKYLDFPLNYIMNITDVGHLTGDNLGDADTGEDRLEKAAHREGKSAWDIAEFYTQDFWTGFSQLNLVKPKHFTKATQHIPEQIKLIEQIYQAGFAYQISDGIYFDVAAYEAGGNRYGQLSNIDQVKEGARVEPNPEKKDPRDFALWKFSYPHGRSINKAQDEVAGQRHMEWDSPWGMGFPGWHIECSAMSMKYLGNQFDIHVGGEDLRSTHHPNEIAQAEAATGKKPFVKYWLHGAFLLVDGGRMGKSLGNAYTLHDLKKRQIEPLALRYFYLTSHYRKPQNFTWESLAAAETALKKLRKRYQSLSEELNPVKKLEQLPQYQDFLTALGDDLNLPQALAVVWDVLKSEGLSSGEKKALLTDFDQVLGLELGKATKQNEDKIPLEVEHLVAQRETARQEKNYQLADQIRDKIAKLGYSVEDKPTGPEVWPN